MRARVYGVGLVRVCVAFVASSDAYDYVLREISKLLFVLVYCCRLLRIRAYTPARATHPLPS